MWYFHIIEIQKNIEEKRLVFGRRFEKFLLKKTGGFFQRIDKFLSTKSFCFWSVSLIFLLSIFLRSSLDIGGDSAFYLDVVAKIAEGKKYYFDFYEPNFPLAFWLHLIPFFIAKTFGFNSWIAVEFFINLLGLATIIFSARILQKTNLSQIHQNLIITSFALGFFLRYYGLESNDFATKTSFFLVFSYLYICFSFSRKTAFSKKEIVSRGILMALLPCLKLHYIILPLMIEIHNFRQKKSFRFFMELDKLAAIFVGFGYLFLMLKFTPEFFKFIIPISSNIYPTYSEFTKFFSQIIYEILTSEIIFFGSIFLIFLRKEFLPEDKILFLVFSAASLILLAESLYSPDQISCFFGLISFVIIKIFYDFVKSSKFDFRRDKTLICCMLLLLFVACENIEKLKNLVVLWWVIMPVIFFFFYKKLSRDKFLFRQKNIFLSGDLFFVIFIVTFPVALAIGVKLVTKDQHLFLIFSYISFFVFLSFYEKTYAKFYQKFSSLLVFIQLLLLITLFANYFSSILQAYKGSGIFKSPNFLSEKIINYTKSHIVDEDSNIIVLSYWIHESSQPLFYLNQSNILVRPAAGYLYKNISYKISNPQNSDRGRSLAVNYFFEDLKKQISKKNTKILFIKTFEDYCTVGFLEYYFQDQEFRRIFLGNYKFAGKIFATKDSEMTLPVNFFSEEKDVFDSVMLSKKTPLYDFEIYLRKDADK